MKNIYRNARQAAWSLVLLGAAFVASCGGDDASGGDQKDCKPNDTRSCVGPAACAGGQICGADGKWGTCDCGGGTGGVNSDGGGAAAGVGASGGVGASAGSGGVAGAGGAAGGTGGASAKCPQGRGPVMIDVGTFCIDSTEVTQKQYQEFLDDQKVSPTQQIGACVANNFDGVMQGECSTSHSPSTNPNLPVGCTDWCDAWGYCAWAGKRLCGRLGGGTLTPTDSDKPAVGEWVSACTQGGSTTYPWGDVAASLCNTGYCDPAKALCHMPVASKQQCHGLATPYDAVFDLLGNSAEWIDSCDVSLPNPGCELAGGSYFDPLDTCAGTIGKVPWGHSPFRDFGVRCCADLKGT